MLLAFSFFESSDIRLILRPAQRPLILNQVRPSYHRNLKAIETHHDFIWLCCHEIDTGNFREDVDPSRSSAKLNNHSRCRQITRCEIGKWGSEVRQGPPYTPGILVGTSNPQIDVARSARESVSRNRIRANQQELNFLFAKRG